MEEHGRRTWSGGRGRSGAENDRQIERLINHVKNLGHRLRLLQPVTEQSLYLLRWDPSYVNFARSNRSKRNRIRGKDFKGIEKKILLFFSFFSCHNVRSLFSSWFFFSRIKKKKKGCAFSTRISNLLFSRRKESYRTDFRFRFSTRILSSRTD